MGAQGGTEHVWMGCCTGRALDFEEGGEGRPVGGRVLE
jgi:hypothetical protein